MTISDDTLMAYADGELDAAARAAVESAMQSDPQIEKRLAQHQALRQRVQAAYSAELSEALPERLLMAARGVPGQPGGNVVNLQEARAAMQRSAPRAAPRRPSWQSAGALAASLIVGVAVGFFMWGRSQSPLVLGPGGALVARGPLAQALSNQLASEQSPSSSVRVEVSFLAKSGEYCRTFSLSGETSPSGLACRHGDEWQVQTLARGAAGGDSEYRTAGSGLPASILKSVEGQIAGEPLDQAGEKAARDRGWKSIAP
jgi:hypothetical protein